MMVGVMREMMMPLLPGGQVTLEHLELYLHLCLAVRSTSVSQVRPLPTLLLKHSDIILLLLNNTVYLGAAAQSDIIDITQSHPCAIQFPNARFH